MALTFSDPLPTVDLSSYALFFVPLLLAGLLLVNIARYVHQIDRMKSRKACFSSV